MVLCGGIQPGNTIFVHPGTDCVAFSVILIALNMDCEVFTAVNTSEEKQSLTKQFPKLKEENIGKTKSKNQTFCKF